MKRTSYSEEPVLRSTVNKVKYNKILKEKPKTAGRKKWQKGHWHKSFEFEERETEFLNCAIELHKNMLDNKEEEVMSNHADKATT